MGGVSKSVVREHYYLVRAIVYDDGSHDWDSDVSITDSFDLSRPVFDLDSHEWYRVTDDILDFDYRLGNDLSARLEDERS